MNFLFAMILMASATSPIYEPPQAVKVADLIKQLQAKPDSQLDIAYLEFYRDVFGNSEINVYRFAMGRGRRVGGSPYRYAVVAEISKWSYRRLPPATRAKLRPFVGRLQESSIENAWILYQLGETGKAKDLVTKLFDEEHKKAMRSGSSNRFGEDLTGNDILFALVKELFDQKAYQEIQKKLKEEYEYLKDLPQLAG